jgi:hypothetical protein
VFVLLVCFVTLTRRAITRNRAQKRKHRPRNSELSYSLCEARRRYEIARINVLFYDNAFMNLS